MTVEKPFYVFCPYCGSSDIRKAGDASTSAGDAITRKIGGNAGIDGPVRMSIGGNKERTESFKENTSYLVKYLCNGCGKNFDNGDTLRVLERDFRITDSFVQKYRLATGFNDFGQLMKGLERSSLRKKGFISKMNLDKSSEIGLKIDRRKRLVVCKKEFEEDGRIVFTLEDIREED